MTDIAYAPASGPGPRARSRPRLEVVLDGVASGPAGAETSATGESRVWRAAALGAVIGFVVVTVVGTIAGTLGGIGAGGAFGLAFFVAGFGGVGFGFMMGGQIALGQPVSVAETSPAKNR